MRATMIGDSVCWGQGLKEEHKFHTLIAAGLGSPIDNLAHSGAIIGMLAGDDDPEAGREVPLSYPTVRHQWLQVASAADVDLVICNGGINDVDFRRILNPLTSESELKGMVQRHCGQQMRQLLRLIASMLKNPAARVIVVGYYPILSSDSTHFFHAGQLTGMLDLFGVSLAPTLTFGFAAPAAIPPFIRNCITFWQESNTQLQWAVDQANGDPGAHPRLTFAKLDFTEENAVFASNPLLWGLEPDLSAEDEVADVRGPQCEAAFGDLVSLPSLLQCYRASVGHPNIAGAASIANTVLNLV